MSAWEVLYQYRTPVDPDYGGATSTLTVWLDNIGGIVVGMDQADGDKVIVLPIPRREVGDFSAALHGQAAA